MPSPVTITFNPNFIETWSKTEFHCPACGEKAVWVKEWNKRFGHPDERTNVCAKCKAMFMLKGGVEIHAGNDYITVVVEELRKESA